MHLFEEFTQCNDSKLKIDLFHNHHRRIWSAEAYDLFPSSEDFPGTTLSKRRIEYDNKECYIN